MEAAYNRLFNKKTLESSFPDQLIEEWRSICDYIVDGYNAFEPDLEKIYLTEILLKN